MSKKYNGHITLQLEPGEACVVMERKFWDHMIEWYGIMARETSNYKDRENWNSVIEVVQEWLDNTYYDPNTAIVIEDDDDFNEWN
jgi:hypothetical protein